jgi:hypothetical protein
MYPGIYDPPETRHAQHRKRRLAEDSFQCRQCGALVYTQPILSGVQNRNHCPYCLCSLHVDHFESGDRLSACKGIMHPIGLAVKPGRNKYGGKAPGELLLIHHCLECGKLSINRLAADDQADMLMEIFYASKIMEISLASQLDDNHIRILTEGDIWIVESQLFGNLRH